MKRFHVHISVNHLDQSIAFYSKLFGAAPTVTKDDYAKWMIEDPRINFAISANKSGDKIGINHLGLQVDSNEELAALEQSFAQAGLSGVEQHGAACCYAKSDKTWLEDPQGIAWENFHSLGSIPMFGANASEQGSCTPKQVSENAARACTPKGAGTCC